MCHFLLGGEWPHLSVDRVGFRVLELKCPREDVVMSVHLDCEAFSSCDVEQPFSFHRSLKLVDGLVVVALFTVLLRSKAEVD